MNRRKLTMVLLGVAVIAAGQRLLSDQDESTESTKKTPGPVNGVPAEVLTREIEANVKALGPLLETPDAFKRGYREVARRLTTLAVMFHWISTGDSDAPFSREAAFLRTKLSGAASQCKTANAPALESAQRLHKTLVRLESGERIAVTDNGEKDVKFAAIADRPPLMQRCEEAFRQTFGPAIQNEETFKAAKLSLRHEGYVTLILMAAAHDPSRELADDEEYKTHAARIAKELQDLIDATEAREFESARRAYQGICVTCAKCHASFR